MSWLFRRREEPPSPRLPHARPMATAADDDIDAALALGIFACSTCGRTDLPEAGDWNPPICLECDAAINFDHELMILEDDL